MMEGPRHYLDYLKDENGAFEGFEGMVGKKRERFKREIVLEEGWLGKEMWGEIGGRIWRVT